MLSLGKPFLPPQDFMLIDINRSVVGRFLNGSWWPTILRTDAASASKVGKRVVVISIFSTVGLVILAAAAVVTPLGLYDAVGASRIQAGQFIYSSDTSSIGAATLDRNDYNTSRTCGFWAYVSCPGQYEGFSTMQNDSGLYLQWESNNSYISTVIPDNITLMFSSGREGDRATVATPFDLEYRSYILADDPKQRKSALLPDDEQPPDPQVDHYAPRTVGQFQYGDMIILADDFVIRDGIIADMKNGGLGFRNHTIPATIGVGTDWTESLLWLEPETICVDNNLTVEFSIPPYYGVASQNSYLVDNGGVTHKPDHYPFIDLNESQIRPELEARAHKGAVLNNFNLRQILGISSQNMSYTGKRFILPNTVYTPGVVTVADFDLGLPGAILYADPRKNITTVKDIGKFTLATFEPF